MLVKLLLLLTFLPLNPQAQTFNPRTIVFQGAPAYTPAALTALAAVPNRRPLTQSDIEAAMTRLADSGLFTEIRFTVNDAALTFVLAPQPSSLMLPAVYANFILWNPSELTPLIHARVPLYNGTIPTTGTFQGTVVDALTAILSDKLGPAAAHPRVEAILAQDKSVVFSITEPTVQIRQVQVATVSSLAAAKVDGVRAAFAATGYDRRSPDAVRDRLIVAYQDLGFLDIAIDLPTQSPPVIQPSHILLDLATTAHEGAQYHIATLELPTSTIVSKADLEKAITLKSGDPASRIELLSAQKRLEVEFTRRGYLDTAIALQSVLNTLAHTVSYTLTAAPGELYHLKSLQVANMNDQQQKDFEKRWKLTPGSPFDGTYLQSFLPRNSPAVPSFQGYTADYKIVPNRTDHTVDLTVVFRKSTR